MMVIQEVHTAFTGRGMLMLQAHVITGLSLGLIMLGVANTDPDHFKRVF